MYLREETSRGAPASLPRSDPVPLGKLTRVIVLVKNQSNLSYDRGQTVSNEAARLSKVGRFSQRWTALSLIDRATSYRRNSAGTLSLD